MTTLGDSADKDFEELRKQYRVKGLVDTLVFTKETYQKDKPLQVFPNPLRYENTSEVDIDGEITIEFPEYTSNCPKTGQPDFAVVTLLYTPDQWCVELKAYKLYLNSYRNEGHFYEEATELIFKDLLKVLDPLYLCLTMEFNARGGMPVKTMKTYTRISEEV